MAGWRPADGLLAFFGRKCMRLGFRLQKTPRMLSIACVSVGLHLRYAKLAKLAKLAGADPAIGPPTPVAYYRALSSPFSSLLWLWRSHPAGELAFKSSWRWWWWCWWR